MTRSNPIQFSAGQRVTLPFRARWAYIDNPTGNTVLVREGNTDQPANLAEADWWVEALKNVVMPCNASEFGLGIGSPFSTQQAGLPTSALAIFGDASEPMPSIGSNAALSVMSAGAPERSLFLNGGGQAAGSYATNVPLPSDIHSIMLANFSTLSAAEGIGTITVTGVQSGLPYASFSPITENLSGSTARIFKVFPSLDSSLQVAWSVLGVGGHSNWRMLGFVAANYGAWDENRGQSLVGAFDGDIVSIGNTADADTALTVIGRLKQLLTRLPAALINGAVGVSQVLPPAEQPLALAARTVSAGFLVRDARGAKGVLVILRVTVASGTGGLTVQLRAIDVLSNVFTICADPAVVIAAGTTLYLLYPFTPPALAGQLVQQVQQPLPERFAVRVLHGDATSYTYALDLLYLA